MRFSRMRIAICVKQVPDTAQVEIDPETRTLRREGVESILNPLDTFAVEEGLRIREAMGGEITAVSMGPPQSESVLREVMAMGVDHAVLVSGKEFAGSDTWATSLAIARTLEGCGPWDIILCGKQAVDGDTAHVGPELAAHLGIPQVTFVRTVLELNPNSAVVERLTESGTQEVVTPLPALLTVLKDLNEPRWPNMAELYRARFAPVRQFRLADLNLEGSEVGLEGSPTRVIDMFSPETERDGLIFDEDYEEGFERLLCHLDENGVINFSGDDSL